MNSYYTRRVTAAPPETSKLFTVLFLFCCKNKSGIANWILLPDELPEVLNSHMMYWKNLQHIGQNFLTLSQEVILFINEILHHEHSTSSSTSSAGHAHRYRTVHTHIVVQFILPDFECIRMGQVSLDLNETIYGKQRMSMSQGWLRSSRWISTREKNANLLETLLNINPQPSLRRISRDKF